MWKLLHYVGKKIVIFLSMSAKINLSLSKKSTSNIYIYMSMSNSNVYGLFFANCEHLSYTFWRNCVSFMNLQYSISK